MLEYPTIDKIVRREQCYVFDKIDGSNIRAEWNREKGFWKFGRRHGLLDASTPILLRAPQLIEWKYKLAVARALKSARVHKAVLFFEFYGEHSFAGNHDVTDIHDVILIDASFDMKTLVEPREFCKVFSEVQHVTLLAHQQFSAELESAIRSNFGWET